MEGFLTVVIPVKLFIFIPENSPLLPIVYNQDMHSNLIHHHDKIELEQALEFLPIQISAVQAAC